MNILQKITTEYTLFDGATGSLLQKQGLKTGEKPELWNLTHKEEMRELHRAYAEAGADIVKTNTFGANRLKFDNLKEIVYAAVDNARIGAKDKFVALSVGPSGKLLKPFGELEFEDAVALFGEVIRYGAERGADAVLLETFTDCYETKAAVLAAKENCNLPIFVTNAYGEDGKLSGGTTPEAMVAMLEGLGVDALGINCSLGPKQMLSVVKRLTACASVPVIVNPNAGMPRIENGATVYDVSQKDFLRAFKALLKCGIRIIGGCCGTTPQYIAGLKSLVANKVAPKIRKKNNTVVSSATHAVYFGKRTLIIGERINPTGKPKFKQALKDGDLEYALTEGIKQQECGADILDLNVGFPEIDEREVLPKLLAELQSVSDLPIQIDTSDTVALERALRLYNGKPMINSVNGKKESMEAVFPLVKKYGGVVVALTLDEDGIPSAATDRLKIAAKIKERAAEYGINGKDIVFDALTMAVSADKSMAQTTLKALTLIKKRLKCHTVLGVSNVSFGLANRQILNAHFLSEAIYAGLDGAIINPFSADMLNAFYSANALNGQDDNFESYINYAVSNGAAPVAETALRTEDLTGYIIKGLKNAATAEVAKLLEKEAALDIINNRIIPALDTVGRGFENKTVFLPGLLVSAEAALAAVDVIKKRVGAAASDKGEVVLATVKGDIHDIGKNIVKILLESHGYKVIDLGRDVSPESVLEAVERTGAKLVGLSALMTTTVPSMEATIALLKARAECKIVVGGAVLTDETAKRIGADYYAKDATETVRVAAKVYSEV